MVNSYKVLSALLTIAGVASSQPALSYSGDQTLGKVHFENSCSEEASANFDKGMLYQHSFWYNASQKAFEQALKEDPKCAIAYWGIALSLLWNPHATPPPTNLPEGAAALAKGQAISGTTERERDYLTALSEMYKDFDKVDHRTRVLNYAKAMEQLATKYPKDDEAQIFYALALNISASPADKTYANQLKGAAILETIWDRQPDHPGVAHYLIHLYDAPALAGKGLKAAQRYAKVAPDAPHAQHMPSHIFTRVGAWADSISSNASAARAAKEEKSGHDQLHAMDYQVYAFLQLGQDDKAKAIIDEMPTVTGFTETFLAGPFALAASPARYAVERNDWKAAASLDVRPSPLPYVPAISWYAKALGAARSGDIETAKAGIAKLVELRDQLREKKDAYWSEQVDIQSRIATAWVQYASGNQDQALKMMSDAADAEDKTDKHPVTPGPLAPARDLYGAMLLQHGDANEALIAFEATMQKEPNRLNTILSAAKAAVASGDNVKARDYYSTALGLASNTSTTRPEVVQARAYLASAR